MPVFGCGPFFLGGGGRGGFYQNPNTHINGGGGAGGFYQHSNGHISAGRGGGGLHGGPFYQQANGPFTPMGRGGMGGNRPVFPYGAPWGRRW